MSSSISNDVCQCNTGVDFLDFIPKAFFYNSEQIMVISLSLLQNSHEETNHHKYLSGRNNNNINLVLLGIV